MGKGRHAIKTEPFDVSEKMTANMASRKRVTDHVGDNTRMPAAYYIWHNNSGVKNKQAVTFECSLRNYVPRQTSE